MYHKTDQKLIIEDKTCFSLPALMLIKLKMCYNRFLNAEVIVSLHMMWCVTEESFSSI